jgi:hypothetical protein
MTPLEILDPTMDAPTQTAIAWAPRPDSLAGTRIGLIENTKFNSDRLLLKIGEILTAEYGAGEVRLFRKHNSSVPAHQELIEELRQTCDVMVAGIGD